MRLGTDRSPRWAAVPLLIGVLIQGIPLTLRIEPLEEPLSEERHDALVKAATSVGFESTVVPLVIWGGLYLVAAFAVAHGRRPRLPVSRFPSLCLFIALVPLSALWSGYPIKVLVGAVHAIGITVVALAAAQRYQYDLDSALQHLGLATGLNILVHVSAIALAPGLAMDWHGRWTGLVGNANVLGFFVCCAVWANSAALLVTVTRRRALVHVTLLLTAVIALAGSRSVTSALSASVAVSGILLLRARQRLRQEQRYLSGAFVAAVVPIAASTAVLLSVRWNDATAVVGRSSDMSGRTQLWSDAVSLILERPLLGWSFDDSASLLSRISFSQGHFHNGFLDVAVKGGIVAIVLTIAFLTQAIWDISRAQRRYPLAVPVLLPLLASFIVNNISEVTLAAWRDGYWMLVVFTACWAGLASRSSDGSRTARESVHTISSRVRILPDGPRSAPRTARRVLHHQGAGSEATS